MRRLLLAFLLAGCAAPSRRAEAPLAPRLIATGTVLDITPRFVLEELGWEHVVLVQTAEGELTVYAGDEDPGVRPGDKVRVSGERVGAEEVAGEVDLLDFFDAS